MRWNDRRRSNNVEDRRGQPSSASGGGNLPLGLIALLLRTKYGFVIIIVLVIASFMGFDFNTLTGATIKPHNVMSNKPHFIMKSLILVVLF